MKRSTVNALLEEARVFIDSYQFRLPPFAFWGPADWVAQRPVAGEILARGLGWDITDFDLGDYARKGLLLFTLRNGAPENLKTGRGKLYAEKLLVVGENQVTPMHYHWQKTEDIINRGGGQLMLKLYNGTAEGDLTDTDVKVQIDSITRTVPAGGIVSLEPGESITLEPYCYHSFWAADAPVLAGEVSTVNDDNTDNRFYEPLGRFSTVEEDAEPLHYLVSDYPTLLRAAE
ncbi:MAG: D-lyxose/D-mannose family sugar isomerase [Anaerolineae bacterium]|nr:D-lyxose/D-mannose family sugar isomerase [Anaerolineae bacterium]